MLRSIPFFQKPNVLGGSMKHFNRYLFTLLFSFLIYSVGYSQNFAVSNNHTTGTSPQSPNDLVVVHYDGDNAGNSVGDGGTTFIGGARYRASIMGAYTGGELQFVQFHYTQAATGLTIMIYDAGTATAPGALLLTQPLDLGSLTVGDWNQVALSTNIPISGNDLWVCLQVEDATAASYPLGVDAGPADPDGDFVNDSGTWDHLNDFGLNYNWNIRGVVETSPSGGGVIFSDNFDSYVAGQQLACQNPTDWTTWSLDPCNATEDAYVSSNFAHSGANSFVVAQNNDEVHYWGPETSGKWQIDLYNYIPTGATGYFNTLSQFIATQEWGLEVYFNAAGAGSINAGGNLAATFNIVYDTWVMNSVIVDLDNDVAEYWYNGAMVYQWQWTLGASGTPIALSLEANDFFGAAATDEMYVDDYTVTDLTNVPVELTSFTASTNNLGQVELNWNTATETNNRMFEIERKDAQNNFATVGFVNGSGTSTQPHSYTFVDKNVNSGTYTYRLKQIDFDGRSEYSNNVEVSVSGPATFDLSQNYPNPFNPTTSITYNVPQSGNVTLAVYNTIGQQVAMLVNGNVTAGIHTATFNAKSLPSGAYFYKLQQGSSVMVKKMLLLK
jgi:hypothetical protein